MGAESSGRAQATGITESHIQNHARPSEAWFEVLRRSRRSVLAPKGASGVCRLPPTGFVVRFRCVDILPSALRHGVDEADIDHAIRQAAVVEEVAQDPTRYLVIGPDRSGNLLGSS